MTPLRSLVLVAFLAACAVPAGVRAQSRLARVAEGRAAPDGNVVAELRSGTSWSTGVTRNGWTLLTISGWIDASRFAGRRDSFPESIGGSATLRIRERPSLEARILGEFRAQAGVRVLERRGAWARVRRDVWVRANTIAAAAESRAATKSPTNATTRAAAANPRDAAPVEPAAEVEPEIPAGALRTARAAQILRTPTGEAIGEIRPGAVVEPIARDRAMVRVRIDAWIPDSLLTPADTSLGATLTAADLKQDPDGAKGKTVKWAVQVVSLQKADGLRRDLSLDESYLLALGPGDENAILYVVVPAALMQEARELPPMAKMLITARIRNGRSDPTGAPILELLTMSKR